VCNAYQTNPEALSILAKLAVSGATDPHFSIVDGVIRFDGKIWLGPFLALQQRVFQDLHSSALGGHSGALATFHIIRQLFYWPHMKSDIVQWVQSLPSVNKQNLTELSIQAFSSLYQFPILFGL
jgi:hypothetical protein